MRMQCTPSDKLKERLGHVAVGALLAVVFWASYGCGESGTPAVDDTVGHAASPTTAVPTVPVSVSDPIPATSVEPRTVTFEEAERAYRDKQYAEATDLFTIYTDQRPENMWGHYMLGLSAWKSGQHETAETAFYSALDIDPEHVKSLLNLSRVFLEVNRPVEALERVQEALLIDPALGEAFRVLGRARHELGLIEEAIDAYWEAIVLDDHDVWSMNNLGLILIHEERFEEALGPLARATEIRSDVAVFQNNLGIALERLGHDVDAAEAYRAAVQVDDAYEKASVNLARVQRHDSSGIGRADLTTFALRFVNEVERLREPVTAEVPSEMISSDSTRVPERETPEPSPDPPLPSPPPFEWPRQ